MDEMNAVQFGWTEKEWEIYQQKTVTIPIDLFDAMAGAVELVATGKRPNAEQRKQWQKRLDQCQGVEKFLIESVQVLSGKD